MKYLVTKTLPQGQAPGTVVDLNADEAAVLSLPGIDAIAPIRETESEPPPAAAASTVKRRGYQRRDLQATES